MSSKIQKKKITLRTTIVANDDKINNNTQLITRTID
jgi:hypothetical protein